MKTHSALPGLMDANTRAALNLIEQESEIVLFSCLFWQMDETQVIEPRTLNNDFLYIPVAGRFRCRVGALESAIGPGQFIMVAEGVRHEAWMAEGCQKLEVFALHLHAYSRQNESLFSAFASPFGCMEPIGAWHRQLAVLTHLMGRAPETGRKIGGALIRTLLTEQLMHGQLPVAPPSVGDVRIWRALVTIRETIEHPPTVSQLAREAGLSTAQFRKLFARHVGQSPKAFSQQIRLRQARALLLSNPTLPVKEVARLTGFHDPHYLNAVFKQQYGVPPSQARETLDT